MNTRSNGPPVTLGSVSRAAPTITSTRSPAPADVGRGPPGVPGPVLQRGDSPVRAGAASQPDRAEAAQCPDLQDATGPDRGGEQAQELALLRRDGDLRQPGGVAVP